MRVVGVIRVIMVVGVMKVVFIRVVRRVNWGY